MGFRRRPQVTIGNGTVIYEISDIDAYQPQIIILTSKSSLPIYEERDLGTGIFITSLRQGYSANFYPARHHATLGYAQASI